MFNASNQELSVAVAESIERQVTAEWVQEEIDRNVRECIKKAVGDVSNNYNLSRCITNLISDQIANIIEEKEKK